MLDTEGHWSEALTSNNIRAIIRWLRKLPADGTLGASDYIKSSSRSRSSCPYFQKHSSITSFCVWFTNIYIAAGDTDVEEILLTFSCWVQRASEFAKKELLTLCKIMFFSLVLFKCLNFEVHTNLSTSSHRFQPLPGPVDVSRPELFHQGTHAGPETEEPSLSGPVGKKAAYFPASLARYVF